MSIPIALDSFKIAAQISNDGYENDVILFESNKMSLKATF